MRNNPKYKYKPESLKDYIILIFSLIIPQSIGILGALTTQTGLSSWYNELTKPFFNPPSWLFGPVWTILYLCIGLVFYLIYKNKNISSDKKKILITLFIFQMILNGIWTPIFFGMQNLFLAMIIIILLDIILLTLLYKFKRYNLKIMFALWVPYVIWVLFASLLNISLWILN
jgi:tryptophan-rich sensory protein